MRERHHRNARFTAAGIATLVIGIAFALAGPASASVAGSHMRAQKGEKGGGHSAPAPLVDGGGKLVPVSTTYAIWWGPPSGFPADAQGGIKTLLKGFGGSSYLATANQYMRGATASSSFGGSLVDTSAPPTHTPSTSTIVNEVASVLAANSLTPDPNAVYLVYTSNFPHVSFCAWHAAGTIGATTVQVGYLPNTTGVTGCGTGTPVAGIDSYTPGTRSLADSTAHEFMESVTDPVPVTGWADKNGQEIGDKCNFVYSTTPIVLSNGSKWQIQEEWSNAAAGCVPGL